MKQLGDRFTLRFSHYGGRIRKTSSARVIAETEKAVRLELSNVGTAEKPVEAEIFVPKAILERAEDPENPHYIQLPTFFHVTYVKVKRHVPRESHHPEAAGDDPQPD
jgi:hypothetical protein